MFVGVPSLSRRSVLGVNAFSSASAIPQFFWTKGIYMID